MSLLHYCTLGLFLSIVVCGTLGILIAVVALDGK